jgi:ribosomal protein S2
MTGREANYLHIPVIVFVDINSDCISTNYLIPANDDSTKPIKVIREVLRKGIQDLQNMEISKIF